MRHLGGLNRAPLWYQIAFFDRKSNKYLETNEDLAGCVSRSSLAQLQRLNKGKPGCSSNWRISQIEMMKCSEEISLEGTKLVVFLQASRIHSTGSLPRPLVYPAPAAPLRRVLHSAGMPCITLPRIRPSSMETRSCQCSVL